MPTVPSPHWPSYLPQSLVKPDTTLSYNLEVSAARYGRRTAIGFFGRDISYSELHEAASRFAGWLVHRANVAPGDRVMLYMQNCPQWLMAYYGALRADAVVVPANPMYKPAELRHLLEDSGAVVLVCSSELLDQAREAARGSALRQVVVASYADYLPETPLFELPAWMTAAAAPRLEGAVCWQETLAAGLAPQTARARPEDLAMINYTSGSTGVAKGCMHTHQTIMHTVVGLCTWHGHAPGTVFLGVAPMYQVAGLIVGVNCAIYVGGTLVPMPRWDRRMAASLIAHYRVRFAGIAPTAIIDMLSDPQIDRFDLSSLRRVSFGGASMPESVWQTVNERLGLSFIEAYGMTETAATTHINPIDRPKRQCAGLSFFDTDARVIHPDTGAACGVGEAGEIVIRGPQLFKGYWKRSDETESSFIDIDGQRYFRSGDIGYVDGEGYFFITDRLKRMINASGFKVWPAEVESMLYGHPAVQEACVISTRDPYRGESVKAVVVLRAEARGRTTEQDIIDWARGHMAAYKYPRTVEFVDSLPKSQVGKVLWRELQDAEAARPTFNA